MADGAMPKKKKPIVQGWLSRPTTDKPPQKVILDKDVQIEKLDYKVTKVLPDGYLLLTRTSVIDNEFEALHSVRLDRHRVLANLKTEHRVEVERFQKFVKEIQTMFPTTQSEDVQDELGKSIMATISERGVKKRKIEELEEQTEIKVDVITERRIFTLLLPPMKLFFIGPKSSPLLWCPNVEPVLVEIQMEMQQSEEQVSRPVEKPVLGEFAHHIGGEFCSPPNRTFQEVTDVAVDNENIYVVDSFRQCIGVFDLVSNLKKTQWGSFGKEAGQFHFARHENKEGQKYFGGAIAVYENNLYVSDTYNCRVQVLNTAGKFLCSWGSQGGEEGQFFHPCGIAANEETIFVSDTGNHRVQAFCRNTKVFSGSWGTFGSANGQFNNPRGLTVDSDHLYVCDWNNSRIQVFDLKGVYVTKLEFLRAYPPSNPSGIALTSTCIFVSEYFNHQISVFRKSDLTFLSSVGTKRSWGDRHWDEGQFNYPTGLAVKSGHLYVADSGNHRVQIFR